MRELSLSLSLCRQRAIWTDLGGIIVRLKDMDLIPFTVLGFISANLNFIVTDHIVCGPRVAVAVYPSAVYVYT